MLEKHLMEIFNNINEGVYILNKEGQYIYCNSAFLKMVGATKDDIIKEKENNFN